MKTQINQIRRLDVRGWTYSLIASTIGGGATSASAWLGLAAAKSAGLDVPALNLTALGVVLASGALTSFFAVLSKSPLPPVEVEEDIPGQSKQP